MIDTQTPFTHLLRVRYAECDPQNVVFNARYAEYADIAATEFMRAIWGDYKELVGQGIDNQVVNLNIAWKASAQFDDVIAIQVHTSRIGNTSFTLTASMRNFQTGVDIASAEIVYVMVASADYAKMPIPEDMKKALEMGAPHTTVNHAGVQV